MNLNFNIPVHEGRRVIVCIPAFNEAKSVRVIIEKAKKFASEVIVCDDGSIDSTGEIAEAAGATVTTHEFNKGYGAAIKTLFHAALEKDADFIVTLDADGQHEPDQIPDFIRPLADGDADIVIGSRFLDQRSRDEIPRYRAFGIKTITRFIHNESWNISDAQSGFRAYSKKALAKLKLYELGMSISTEILFRAREKDFVIREIPIKINYDVESSSTHNFLIHGLGVLASVIQFISLRKPLVFYGIPGIALLIVAAMFTNNVFVLFGETKFISTNMIMISLGSAVLGVVLLATGTILYSITALLRGHKGAFFPVMQFVSLRNPLAFYGIPGAALLIIAAILASYIFETYNTAGNYTPVITVPILVALGLAIIGVVLLATGTILHTLTALLKGRIKDF
jgi:glycosyltransferase involved in cell wall biosynthesis